MKPFFCCAAILIAASIAPAATMNWGDKSDPAGDVMFLQVEEDSGAGTPILFGDPTAVGNQLVYSPTGFQSQSSGGGADLIDSTATTTIMAKDGKVINNIMFSEFGDYSLTGLTGGQAQATVGAAFFYTVLEIDNSPVTLGTETASLVIPTGVTLAQPNGGDYNRPGDDGTAVPWSGSVMIDLDAYLASENLTGSVTKVRLKFDNTLTTAADAVSNAFIKKKEAGGVIITTNVPEPTTALLLAIAGFGAFAVRKN